jgi:hypothetical protein
MAIQLSREFDSQISHQVLVLRASCFSHRRRRALPPPQRCLRLGEIGAKRPEAFAGPGEFLDGVPAVGKAGDGGKHALIHGTGTLMEGNGAPSHQ